MAGVLPPEISIAYGLWIQLLLNQSPKFFWDGVWSFTFSQKLVTVLLKQLP